MKINYAQIITAAIGAWLSGALSLRVGNESLTIVQVPGNPVHFTFNLAYAALLDYALGKSGTFQVGSIAVTVAAL
jgi:hypothetical protein